MSFFLKIVFSSYTRCKVREERVKNTEKIVDRYFFSIDMNKRIIPIFYPNFVCKLNNANFNLLILQCDLFNVKHLQKHCNKKKFFKWHTHRKKKGGGNGFLLLLLFFPLQCAPVAKNSRRFTFKKSSCQIKNKFEYNFKQTWL